MALQSQLLVAVVLVMGCFFTTHAQTRDLTAVDHIDHLTRPYNASRSGTDPLGNLALNDSRLQKTVTGLSPEQVS